MIGYLNNETIVFFSTPITILLVLLEIYISTRYDKSYYTVKDTKENIFLGACYLVVDILSKGLGVLLLTFFFYYGWHWAPAKSHLIIYWISLVLLEDFSYWFMHLMDHKVRILWAGHIHHHSSAQFNFSVGLRSAVFEPIEKFFFFIPLAWIGYHPLDITLIYIIAQGWGTFVHTRGINKLGPLEYLFTTPSHHRVHHGRNPKYLDRNYGMFLIIWDRLFKTFEPEDPQEPVEYGTVKQVAYKTYPDIIFHEYKQVWKDVRKAKTLKHRIRSVFGRPGAAIDTEASKQPNP